MEREQKPIIVVEDVSALGLLVFCYTCCQTLYETPDKNPTTQTVADTIAQEHYEAYGDEHSITIIDFKPIKYERSL